MLHRGAARASRAQEVQQTGRARHRAVRPPGRSRLRVAGTVATALVPVSGGWVAVSHVHDGAARPADWGAPVGNAREVAAPAWSRPADAVATTPVATTPVARTSGGRTTPSPGLDGLRRVGSRSTPAAAGTAPPRDGVSRPSPERTERERGPDDAVGSRGAHAGQQARTNPGRQPRHEPGAERADDPERAPDRSRAPGRHRGQQRHEDSSRSETGDPSRGRGHGSEGAPGRHRGGEPPSPDHGRGAANERGKSHRGGDEQGRGPATG
jgi:hypothetical protein